MSNKTVFASKIRTGDVVTDPSGDYAQYGAVTSVTRKAMSYVATTESGTNLSFAATDRVQVRR